MFMYVWFFFCKQKTAYDMRIRTGVQTCALPIFFASMMIAFPVITNQLWKFVAPGLYRKEKRALLPFLFATPVLFIAGACLAYFVTVPVALKFLLGYQGDMGGIQQEALPSRSEEHTSELQSLMSISYAVFCLKKNKKLT